MCVNKHDMTKYRFKRVPKFPNYLCSENGVIKLWHTFKPIKVHYTFIEASFYPPRMDDDQMNLDRIDSGCPYKYVTMNGGLQYVHRIVALTWVTNPRPDIFDRVDHIDKHKTNNHYSNLRWANPSINASNNDALNVMFVRSVPMGKNRWRRVKYWRARVCILGKQYSLGNFDTFLEGYQVAKTFKKENITRIYKELCDEAQPTRPYLFLK